MKQQTVTWYTPEEMPEEWKDGRDLLCKINNGLDIWCEILYYCRVDYHILQDEGFMGSSDGDTRSTDEVESVLDLNELNKGRFDTDILSKIERECVQLRIELTELKQILYRSNGTDVIDPTLK